MATGELIVFADQDGAWQPNKLERLLGTFSDPLVLAAFSGASLIDGSDTDPRHDAVEGPGREPPRGGRLERGEVLEQLRCVGTSSPAQRSPFARRSSQWLVRVPSARFTTVPRRRRCRDRARTRRFANRWCGIGSHADNAVGIPPTPPPRARRVNVSVMSARSREHELFTLARLRAAEAEAPADRLRLLDPEARLSP